MAETWQAPQPFEWVDHTADIGVRVRGASRAETLARLLLAHAQALTGGPGAEGDSTVALRLPADDPALLAVDTLRAAQNLFVRRKLIVHTVTVERFTDHEVELRLVCGPYDPATHNEGVELKAITYHAAVFAADGDSYLAQVLFDV